MEIAANGKTKHIEISNVDFTGTCNSQTFELRSLS